MNSLNEITESEIILNDSKLGTIDYWENFYEIEKNQFKNNTDLVGEIWFGKNTQKRVINYVKDNFKSDCKILDIVFGNATFLIGLAKNNYSQLVGMDYSQNSICLAESIINNKAEKYPNILNKIRLLVEDINNPIKEEKEFNLIHDKGTMDAFLSNKDHLFSSYSNYLNLKLKKNGTFIITSCNFTKSELACLFSKTKFTLEKEISHKQFTFGGQTGQQVTTLIYKNHF